MKIPVVQYWRLLVNYLRPQWPMVLLLALLMLTQIGLQLVRPQIVRVFIDTATSGGAVERLLDAALVYMGSALASQVLAIAITYVGGTVAWTATNALRIDLARHCLQLDQSFHKAHSPGELIERIDGDVNSLANFFSRFVVELLGNGLLLLGILILLFREDVRVGLGLATFAGLALIGLVRIRAIATPYWTVVRKQMADFYGFVGERLSGTEDIQANGGRDYVLRRFYELTRERYPANMKAGMAGYTMWVVNEAAYGLATVSVYALGAYLWGEGALTIGTIYLLLQYSEAMIGPIAAIRAQLVDLQQSAAGISRVRDLFSTESRLRDPGKASRACGTDADTRAASTDEDACAGSTDDDARAGSTDEDTRAASTDEDGMLRHRARARAAGEGGEREVRFPLGPLSVEARDLSFGYDEGETVLRGVSFELGPGRVLGLLGRTGSGKTTLARLLLRLYDPCEGEFLLGGIPPADVPLSEVRARAGLVTQEVQLFQASVRDNLTFFDRTISDERIGSVLGDLGLSGWLRTLPDELDAELGSGGGGLSAGQAQLLALGRAFLADPGLIILDEASSRLDPATERLIERAVDQLLTGRTAIVIAHRLATVDRADDILILEGGQVVEHGGRAELAGDPRSHLSRLLRTGMEEVLA